MKFLFSTTKDGWKIKETHLYVGSEALAKTVPGQFPYKTDHNDVTEYTYL